MRRWKQTVVMDLLCNLRRLAPSPMTLSNL